MKQFAGNIVDNYIKRRGEVRIEEIIQLQM